MCSAADRSQNPHFLSKGWKKYEYNGIKYRSKWEVEVAKILTGCGVQFEYERWDAGTKTRPDFYLPALARYLEVHPDYHGRKESLPENCVLVKTLSHARSAALAAALKINRPGVDAYVKTLSMQATRGLYQIGVRTAVYLKQEIMEREGG